VKVTNGRSILKSGKERKRTPDHRLRQGKKKKPNPGKESNILMSRTVINLGEKRLSALNGSSCLKRKLIRQGKATSSFQGRRKNTRLGKGPAKRKGLPLSPEEGEKTPPRTKKRKTGIAEREAKKTVCDCFRSGTGDDHQKVSSV